MSHSNTPPPPCPSTIIQQQLPYGYGYGYVASASAGTAPTPTLTSPCQSGTMRYKGTRVRSGKWVSEIRLPRTTKRIWLGTYPTPEMAAAAYDAATLAVRGPEAHLNFPNFILSYPIPASFEDSDIRAAAALAASIVAHHHYQSTTTTPPPPAITGGGGGVSGQEGMVVVGDYFDEDEVLNMPSVIHDMAMGLQISPPRSPSFSTFDDDDIIYSDLYALW
ncbi:hypothetical protein PIB30_079828 [Stylosanthes scabra]|uniref:AP2/ERF domain-containing protein n=1 Tax=Stylosanthes scabra TaxID=79078 RepID=A0ABU6ZPW5_9FABA|nr:hypothetical protein [Stylosanthes scabra]